MVDTLSQIVTGPQQEISMASRLQREHLKDLKNGKAMVCMETANSVVSTDNREVKRETDRERQTERKVMRTDM